MEHKYNELEDHNRKKIQYKKKKINIHQPHSNKSLLISSSPINNQITT